MSKSILVTSAIMLSGAMGLVAVAKFLWGSIWFWVVGVLALAMTIAPLVWLRFHNENDSDEKRYR